MFKAKGLMVFYENMLALNNVSLSCGSNQIVGVFGANSAGKSTLMYTLSGIMDDIQKKEDMAGGERITIRGEIFFQGRDIMSDKPSLRARQGIILCPERRRIFPESTVLENLKIGGYLATAPQASETLDYVFTIFPALKRLTIRGIPERRRAADAGHRSVTDGSTQAASFGRAASGAQPVDPISICQIHQRNPRSAGHVNNRIRTVRTTDHADHRLWLHP